MFSSPLTQKVFRFLQNPFCIAALGVLLLLVVSFLDVPVGNDEGAWGYMGQAWAEHHLLPYSGVADNKTPGMAYLYFVSYSLFGTNIWFPRLLALFAVLLTGVLIYRILARIANKRAALVAMTIFLLLMPLPAVDGSYAQTETFMNLFVIAAFYFLFASEAGGGRLRAAFLSGLCLGVAAAFRQSAVISFVPLLFLLFFLERHNRARAFLGAGALVLGAGVATAFSLLPYLLGGGTFREYLDGAWLFFLRGNVGVIQGGLLHRLSGFLTRFFVPEMFPLAVAVVLLCLYLRKIRDAGFWFAVPLIVWALSDFVSYNLEGTYFPHHLKLPALSWSVSFGVVADFFIRRDCVKDGGSATLERETGRGAVLVAALIVFLVFFQNGYYFTVRAFLKGLNRHDFREVGALVRGMTEPDDTIYVYGLHTGPLYFFAERSSPSRYFETQLLALPGALAELQGKLRDRRPAVILMRSEELPPPWLQEFLATGYVAEPPQYGYAIFRALPSRKGSQPLP